MPRSRLLVPFVTSLALHAGAGVWVKVRGSAMQTHIETRPDIWAGHGVELEPRIVEAALEATQEASAGTPRTIEPHDEEPPAVSERACVTDCSTNTDSAPDREPRATAAPKREATVRRRPARDVKPLPSGSETRSEVSPPTPAGAASAVASSSGAFGAAGLPPGVRYLPLAYTRAISQGSWGVAGFRSAATGRLCDVRVSIAVSDDHTLGPVDYGSDGEREAVPGLCRTLFENARRLIVAGEFSLDPKSLTTGVMRLRITVDVSDEAPRAESDDAPHGLWSESHEPASRTRRGRSSFVLNSGRRVDAFVELE